MPLIMGYNSTESNNHKNAAELILQTITKSVFNSHTNILLNNENGLSSNMIPSAEIFMDQDIEQFYSSLSGGFHMRVFLCLDQKHLLLERWTLKLQTNEPNLVLVNEFEDEGFSHQLRNLENTLKEFLRTVPYISLIETLMKKSNSFSVKCGFTNRSLFVNNNDDFTALKFDPLISSIGNFVLHVEYMSQTNLSLLDFITSSHAQPILIFEPSVCRNKVYCSCTTQETTPTSSSSSISSPLSALLGSPLSALMDMSPGQLQLMTPNAATPKVINTSPSFFSPSRRPGTPPPSRMQLAQSAPVGIPKARKSLVSSYEDRSQDFNNSPSSPVRSLSMSVPALPVYALEDEEQETYVYRRNSLGISPSELHGPFVGSFQESLLSGHMSNTPSTVYSGFTADIAASGKSFIANHIKVPFSAIYYHVDHDTPYVGTIELDKKGYKVPMQGIVQLTVINPSLAPMKTFLVKYDLSEMPVGTKTFIRQKIISSSPTILRYAIHLKFVSPRKGRVYLYKNIRIVFAHRTPDEMDALHTSYEYPDEPRYFLYSSRSSANQMTKLRKSLSSVTNDEEDETADEIVDR